MSAQLAVARSPTARTGLSCSSDLGLSPHLLNKVRPVRDEPAPACILPGESPAGVSACEASVALEPRDAPDLGPRGDREVP